MTQSFWNIANPVVREDGYVEPLESLMPPRRRYCTTVHGKDFVWWMTPAGLLRSILVRLDVVAGDEQFWKDIAWEVDIDDRWLGR